MLYFTHLPSVLIQDTIADCAYLIPAEELLAYKIKDGIASYIDRNIVVFVIPDNEFVEATPPFNAMASKAPNVIIQLLHDQSAYFLRYNDLQKFKIDSPQEYGGYGISFALPIGNEYLESLSPAQLALLQAGESNRGTLSLLQEEAQQAKANSEANFH